METGEAQWKRKAEEFHDTYEALAPAYGYETREDTKVFDPESKNGKLMVAVCKHVITQTLESLGRELAEKRIVLTREMSREGTKVPTMAVSMEDIASVFKRYGVDIGGKGE